LIDETLKLGNGMLFALDRAGKSPSIRRSGRVRNAVDHSRLLDPKFQLQLAAGLVSKMSRFGELFYLPDVERGARADAIEESWFGWQEGNREPCTECNGSRINSVARAVRLQIENCKLQIANWRRGTIEELSSLSVEDGAQLFWKMKFKGREALIARDILPEIRERLKFLREVGLGYLQLGEVFRRCPEVKVSGFRLAAQLGSNLSGVLYILDEPTIGLHARDTSSCSRRYNN